MAVRAAAVSLMLLAAVLAGCVLLPPDGEWWYQRGIQCEEPPWREGPRDGEPARGPYERDEAAEQEVRDHYAAQGVDVEGVVAYRDDRFYPAVCGAADGRHFWLLAGGAFDGAANGWAHRDEGPPEEVWQE